MTTVHTTYTPSLNVSVSSKSGVTLWTTRVANSTVRIPLGGTPIMTGSVTGTKRKVRAKSRV